MIHIPRELHPKHHPPTLHALLKTPKDAGQNMQVINTLQE